MNENASTIDVLEDIKKKLKHRFGKTVESATKEQVYMACAYCVRDEMMDRWTTAKNEISRSGK